MEVGRVGGCEVRKAKNLSKREEFEGVSRLPLVGYARISLADLVN